MRAGATGRRASRRGLAGSRLRDRRRPGESRHAGDDARAPAGERRHPEGRRPRPGAARVRPCAHVHGYRSPGKLGLQVPALDAVIAEQYVAVDPLEFDPEAVLAYAYDERESRESIAFVQSVSSLVDKRSASKCK